MGKEIKLQALELVEDLNNETEERGGLGYYALFEFRFSAYSSGCVLFMGIPIWTEDNDEREYIGDSDVQESLRVFLIRKSEQILKDLNLKMGAF